MADDSPIGRSRVTRVGPINWVNGFDTEPLSSCVVTSINSPGGSAPAPDTFTTVYVDVSCPNHPDD
jgi:hypothetical protein